MVSTEKRKLLLLYQCIIDTGAEVVRSYTEPKLTVNHGGSIATFIDTEKHFFYHQWNLEKTPCCACPKHGCSISKVKNMDKAIRQKMYTYDRNIPYPSGHHKDKVQNCICRYISNNIDIDSFDLADLNFLLRSRKLVLPADEPFVDKIMDIRCQVCHAASSESYPNQSLINLWADFESALLQLAEPKYYRRMVKLQLSTKKETILIDADVERLVTDIEKLREQITELMTDGISIITKRVSGNIQPALDDLRSQLTLGVNNIQTCIQDSKSALNEVQESIRKLSFEFKEHINKVRIEFITEVRKTIETSCNGCHCVNYNIKIDSERLKDDKAKEVLSAQAISRTEQMDLDQEEIEINSVETNCLLLEARSSSSIFRSEKSFKEAILFLIRKVLDAGEVDTSIESTVRVSFEIITPLNDEEIKVFLNIPRGTHVEAVNDANVTSADFLELHVDEIEKDSIPEFKELQTTAEHSEFGKYYHGDNSTEVKRHMSSQNIEETAKQNRIGEKAHTSEKLSKIMLLIDSLGLGEYYPNKMQLSDVMKIKSKSPPTSSELAFIFLENLIMSNFTCRDKLLQYYIQRIKQASKDIHETEQNKLSGDIGDLFGDEDYNTADKTLINPLDLTLTVFLCSSPFLKTILTTKLFVCKLAIPFIYPNLERECLSVFYWPLRWVILETNIDKRRAQNMSVDCPCQIVACVRLGRPSVSKSKLINEVLNDQYHDTFFNKDCSLGTSNRCISDGLIEAAWYIPSGKSKLMNNLTMFLNLRGDSLYHTKQVQFLSKLSTLVIVFLDMSLLENTEIKEQLFSFYDCECGVLLAIDANSYSKTAVREKLKIFFEIESQQNKKTKFSILKVDGSMRSISSIKDEMRKAVCELAKNGTISSLSIRLAKLHTTLDEDDDLYRTVKHTVKSIMDLIPDKCLESKEQVLPLQGKLWKSFSQKLKSVNKSSQYKGMNGAEKIRKEMNADRKKQAEICKKLGPFMNKYLDVLFSSFKSENEFQLLVLWTKMVLDERYRNVLPYFLSKYQSDWQARKAARDNRETNSIRMLQNELDKSEYNLAEASFGFEHLCREIGQMFEALSVCESCPSQLQDFTNRLPDIAVKLLLIGLPFEIMDGDAANVPILWVKAVLSRLKDVLGDKKLLALTVLGIQGSGKSTLLNTMFGLQFAVSAGRCTRGVFMQLVPVANKALPFEYVLVFGTEGLRAPEFAHQNHSYENELATFVIGLGDITIVNIKGENTAELKDVLQISVHAFLRLKLANKGLNMKQSCIFIHQNVLATDANDKMMLGRQKFVEILDEMTKEAADQENIADIQSFNQVIEFNSEQNVWYFSDLWRGDPPMAPVNPGYSENVSSVKEALLFQLTAKRTNFLTIGNTISRIDDLWNGILKDDFVFSFRNSLELKAYNSMEQHCQTITLSLEKFVGEFILSECKSFFLNCKDIQELEQAVPAITIRLSRKISKRLEYLIKDLYDFVEKHSLKDIMIQWVQHKRNRFTLLAESLEANAKSDINNTKEEIRFAKLVLSEKTKHEMEIYELARNLATQMRGEKPDEIILKDKFNSLWSKWISKFTTKDTRDVVPVIYQIESMLYEKFPKDAYFIGLINNLPDDHFYQTAKKLEGSININWISAEKHLSFHRPMARLIRQEKKEEQQTVNVINRIFRAIDTRLIEVNSQDMRFEQSYVTEILNMVTNGISDFNDHSNNEYKFNLLSPFRAMIVLHVVKYVKVFFTRLNDKYNRKHSLKAQIEEYKGISWDLFKNCFESKT